MTTTDRNKIHCINCGKGLKKVSLNSETTELIETDCQDCGIRASLINLFDGDQAIIEIENLKPEEYVARWKKLTKNHEPAIVCPLCGDGNLKKIITKDGGEDLFECKKCEKAYEIKRS